MNKVKVTNSPNNEKSPGTIIESTVNGQFFILTHYDEVNEHYHCVDLSNGAVTILCPWEIEWYHIDVTINITHN